MKNNATPEVRFEGFETDWEEKKLGEICSNFRSGKFLSANCINEKGLYAVYGGNGLRGYTDKSTHSGYSALIGRQGALCGNICDADNDFYATEHAIVVKANELNNTVFLKYLLLKMNLNQYSTQSAQPGLAVSKLEQLSELLPSLFEQEKIGEFFKNLDETIAIAQKELSNLQQAKKGFLQKMFPKNGEKTPEVRFEGFETDWEEKTLGEMGSTFTGLSGKSKKDFGHGEARYITYMNVFSNALSNKESVGKIEVDTKQNQVQFGDVFFTTSSETPEEVGMSSVWLENIPNVYLNSFCFGFRPSIKTDLYYLAFVLRSPKIRNKFTFMAQGISRYNISKTKTMDLLIPLPTLEEQQKIGEFFKNLDELIAIAQKELSNLQQAKKGFLQKMFV